MTNFLPTPLDPAVEAKYAKAVGGVALEKASPVYDLHAVSNHFGSLSSGHCEHSNAIMCMLQNH
jgi:ubiquitin carboxyl-terminal hydrolase 8